MPGYVPFSPISPVNFAMGSVTGYTNGAFVVPTYNLELNNIAKEINALGFLMSAAGIQGEIGGLGYYVQSIAINTGTMAEQLVNIEQRLQTLIGAVNTVANKSEVLSRGLGTISGHMAQQTVVQQVVAVDQMKNNKFQQETTKASQKAAGQEPVVVTPANFVETTKEMVNDITTLNAQTKAAAVVSDTLNTATSYSLTTVTDWVAESAVGTFIKDTYADLEIFVVGVFSKERAEALKAKAKLKTRVGQQ